MAFDRRSGHHFDDFEDVNQDTNTHNHFIPSTMEYSSSHKHDRPGTQLPPFQHMDRLASTQSPRPPFDAFRYGSRLMGGLDSFDRQLLGATRPILRTPAPDLCAAPRMTLPPPPSQLPAQSSPRRIDIADSLFGKAFPRTVSWQGEHAPSSRPLPRTQPSPVMRAVLQREQPIHQLETFQAPGQQLTSPRQSASYTYSPPVPPSTTTSSSEPEHSSPTTRVNLRNTGHPHSQLPAAYLSSSSRPSSRLDLQHAPPIASGIQLISPNGALPDKFSAIFPYPLFNAVQSKCFTSIYESNDNLVVSAPTGSGKTVVLELAICRLVGGRGNQNFKIVYQAPTKALCSERSRDWEKKFSHMNISVAELTGDTSQAEMRRVGAASIIVTTPEKWDSITRKWQDHRKLLEMVELFLIDEVHILKDVRGATLEAVVSRMKTIGANVRFVALSATIPNSEDIAIWLGRDHTNPQLPARRETFGEEFRPVRLQKHIYGFDVNGNEFVFDKFLDQKLPGLIAQHTRKKPILVFCFTRKSCETTAQKLAEYWSGAPKEDKAWPAPTTRIPVVSRDLQEIVRFGVAFHHAGLDVDDRNSVERNFLSGQLGVICCTTTLAVGVNLPCHTVVLKGTMGYQDGKLAELSDLEVMQMLGRAGRPQFDDSATAIILTKTQYKERYETMISGQQILESTLHLNLIEHLNSEVGLRTIKDTDSAKKWLSGTFLSVRLRRNPMHYQLTGSTSHAQHPDERLEEICERDIKLLQEHRLLTDGVIFSSTAYGQAMSKYMVQFDSMKLILGMPRGVGMEELLNTVGRATEFKDLRFKPNERTLFRELNKNPFILHPIKETVGMTQHKISLLIQIELGGVELPNTKEYNILRKQIFSDKKLVFERMNRLVRCVIDCKGADRDSIGTKTALDLARGLSAEAWEGKPGQLRQVPGIGPAAMRKLVHADVRTVYQLAEKDPEDIERIIGRNPPFGRKIQDAVLNFPRLTLNATITGQSKQRPSNTGPIINVKAVLGARGRTTTTKWADKIPTLTFTAETSNGELAYFWRGAMNRINKGSKAGLELLFPVCLGDFDEQIICTFTCEEIVGSMVSKTLRHSLPVSAFVAKRPAPLTSNRPREISGAPSQDFDDDLDDKDLLNATVKTSEGYVPGEDDDHPSDNFPLVDELVHANTEESENSQGYDEVQSAREAVQLPNGKWMCGHKCSNGALTRSGKQCTHRCCHEGLDKPRRHKPPPKKQKKRNPEDREVNKVPNVAPFPRLPTQATGDSHASKIRKLSHPPAKESEKVSMLGKARPEFNLADLDLEVIDLSNVDEPVKPPMTGRVPTRTRSNVYEKNGFSGDEGSSNSFLGDHGRGSPPSGTRANAIEIDDWDDLDPLAWTESIDREYLRGDTLLDQKAADPPKSEPIALQDKLGNARSHDDPVHPEAPGAYEENDPGDATRPDKHETSRAIRSAARLLDLASSSQANGDSQKDNICSDPDEPDSTLPTGFEGIETAPPGIPEDLRGTELKQEGFSRELPSGSPMFLTSDLLETPKQGSGADVAEKAGSLDGKDEPAWLAEFDPTFIDQYRGVVNFI